MSTPPNPFVGPRPLTKSNPIFGRDREIAELRHLVTAERLVLLHSPSGAGKSSLINAGLIPELMDRFDVWEPTRVNAEPPAGTTTNRYVWSAIHGWKKEGEERTLKEFVGARPSKNNILLIFDQFEEILRTDPNDAAGQDEFFSQLAELLSDPAIWALFIIREDYLAPLLSFAAMLPTHLRTRYRLDFLTREQAKEAMRETALTGDRLFQPQALNLLVENLAAIRIQNPDGSYRETVEAGAYVEPMQLQVVCRRLWEAMDPADRSIDAEDITQFGDVTQALAAYYDDFVKDDRSVREWFQEKLIKGNIRSQVQMGPEQSDGLPNRTIEKLLDTHLVRAEKRRGTTWFELAHDRLIEPVLSSNDTWFANNLADFQRRAVFWFSQNKLEGLLLGGSDLVSAQQWAETSKAELTEIEKEFKERSIAKQAAADKEIRQNQRLRNWLRLAMAFAGVAALLGGVLALKWREAQAQERGAKLALARSAIQEANRAISLHQDDQGLAHYARALRLNPESVEARTAIADLLLRTHWWVPVYESPAFNGILLAISQDGRRVVTSSGGGMLQVWDAANGKAIGRPMAHQGHNAAFSVDGTRVVTVGDGDTAWVWDATSGDAIGKPLVYKGPMPLNRAEVRMPGFFGHVNQLAAFSVDGRRIVTASIPGLAQVWDTGTANPIGKPLFTNALINNVAFSADGLRIVTAASVGQVWNASTGGAIGKALAHEGYLNSATFSVDGSRVVTAGDRTVQVWNAISGEAVGKPLVHEWPVRSASFNPDGRRIVTASTERMAQVWDADRREVIGNALAHEGAVRSVEFGADGRRIVTASDGIVHIWDALDWKAIAQPLVIRGRVDSAVFSEDGRQLATAPEGNSVQVWDATNGKPIGKPLVQEGHFLRENLSADGRRVVLVSVINGTAQVWDTGSGEAIGKRLEHKDSGVRTTYYADGRVTIGTGPISRAAFSADGRRVVTVSEEGRGQVWDAVSGEPIGKSWTGFTNWAFSADARRVLASTDLRTWQVWDTSKGAAIGKALVHKGPGMEASFSVDGNLVVTWSGIMAQVWDASSGEAIGKPLLHEREVKGATFNPDGARVVTMSRHSTAQIWNTSNGEAIGKALVDYAYSGSAVFSVDGRRLATVSGDNTVQIWDAATGEAMGKPLVHNSEVRSVAFSPDGRRVVTTSTDNTARIWDVLVDSGSSQDVQLLTELAEAVAGYTVNEYGSSILLPSRSAMLRAIRAKANQLPDTPGTLAHFIRRFLPE